MPDYVRVADFEADGDAIDAIVREIDSSGGAPPDIPAKAITVLADRAGGRARVVVRFDSEEKLRKGSETLDAMDPPAGGSMRRVSVDTFEVVLERQA